MSESRFRSNIYQITFFFSLLVVWVHSANWELFAGQSGLGNEAFEAVAAAEKILGEGLAQMAVPGFFLVSAYLFFRNFTMEKLLSKWKSRLYSVAIPYVIWNLLYYGAYVLGSRLPGLGNLLNRGPIPFDGRTLIQAAFFYLYNPVFWYLFQLILLILLAPLLYFILKRNGTALLFASLLAWAIFKGWQPGPLNTDALLYYSVGGWAGLHRETRSAFAESGRAKDWLAPGAVLGACTLAVWFFGRPGGVLYLNPLATVTLRLTMASAAWGAVSLSALPEAGEWAKHNFFLYAIHFAGVRFLNKAGALMFPGSAAAALAFFLFMPLVMAWFSFWSGGLLRKYTPGIYRILAGGR